MFVIIALNMHACVIVHCHLVNVFKPDMGSITSKCNQSLSLLHNSLPYYYYYHITH